MRAINISKRLPHFYFLGKTMIREGFYLQHSQNVYPHFSREGGWGMGRRPGDAEGKVLPVLFFAAFFNCWCLRHKQQGLAAAQTLT